MHTVWLLLSCRLAMMGFFGMVVTELLTGVNTLQAWGLQSFPFHH